MGEGGGGGSGCDRATGPPALPPCPSSKSEAGRRLSSAVSRYDIGLAQYTVTGRRCAGMIARSTARIFPCRWGQASVSARFRRRNYFVAGLRAHHAA